MSLFNLKNIPPVERIPGYYGRFVHSQNMTLAFWDIKAGSPLPQHRHEQEQIMTLTEGLFELVVDGERHLLKSGDVFIIPSNVLHSGKAISHCTVIDVFNPVRDDYRQKDYTYISKN